MKKVMFFAVLGLTAFSMMSFLSCSAQVPQAKLKTEVDSLAYAYGVLMAQGLDSYMQQNLGVEPAYKSEVLKGIMESSHLSKKDKKAAAHAVGIYVGKQLFADMFPNVNEGLFGPDSTATESMSKSVFISGFLSASENKKLLIAQEVAEPFFQTKSAELQNRANEKIKAENQAFLDANKTKEGVIVLPSGLQYKVIKDATGVKPAMGDTVLVNYVLSDIKGKKIQSNDSIPFVIGQVIPGWNEGVQLMSPGAKYTFYVPDSLGYGERGQGRDIKPYSTLLFDIELLKVMPKVETPAAKPTVQFTPPVIKKAK